MRPLRALAAIALSSIASSCGAAPLPAPARAEPLPVSENQQGRTVEPWVAAVAAEPILGVHLWCAEPSGHACSIVSQALGTGPKDPAHLPRALLTVQDLTDDCSEPTIQQVSHRLAPALRVADAGWRDQAGSYLETSLLDDMYSAAGCINDADQSQPIVKISAASTGQPRFYLVRVWDRGELTH